MADAAYFAGKLVGSFVGNKDYFRGKGPADGGLAQRSRPQYDPPSTYSDPTPSSSGLYGGQPPATYQPYQPGTYQPENYPPESYLQAIQPPPQRAPQAFGTRVEPKDEDISEEDKKLQKLPNAHRIEEIIAKFSDFSFSKLLPKTLEYKTTEGDAALEKNIRALFAPSIVVENFLLKEILLIIISKEDKLMSETQNKKIALKKNLNKAQQKGIKMFYPCLISLIDAALTRCDIDSSQSSENFHAARVVLLLWKEIVSDLNEIFKVIIHGKNAEMFDLGDYPTSLLEIVNIKNKRISAIKKMVGDEKNEILQLSEQLNQGNQDIEAVKAKYANKQSEKGLKNAELLGFEKALRAMTEVKQMVKINIGNISAMNET